MSDKIIHSFQQRRQLEQAIANFAHTQSEAELAAGARKLVHTYPADLVLTLLLKHLDTPDSQVRGGLGHLAVLLPQDEITTALRVFVANRQHSPQARVTAALIAERFLNAELPGALMSDLHNSDEIAFQSLREALDESKRNRHVLLEYVTQMQQLGEEIAFMVLTLLERVAPAEQVELLRLIAQDSRPRVAKAALNRLEGISATEASALRALHTLHFTLPPELGTQIERTLRKLRFTGKRYTPPPMTDWRALLSPADVNGMQTVWLIHMPQAATLRGVLLGFVFDPLQGVLHCFGSETMDRGVLPEPLPIGRLLSVTTDDGSPAVLLEVPFDYGRWLVWQAVARNHQGASEPLRGEYTLYNDLLWQFEVPQVEEAIKDIFERPHSPVAPLDAHTFAAQAAALLAHPAMEEWQLQTGAHLPATRPQTPDAPVDELVMTLLQELETWPEKARLLDALEAGLRVQAGWLYYFGEKECAHQAHTLADQMHQWPLTQNPLLARLLAMGMTKR